jgi:hypothetical protein
MLQNIGLIASLICSCWFGIPKASAEWWVVPVSVAMETGLRSGRCCGLPVFYTGEEDAVPVGINETGMCYFGELVSNHLIFFC